ncbi:MAG: hypothetical protein KF773_34920 [Deltaproteobacteria bacterium]|nr:hypothetical protein [Deltaproteobacteria bacterium]
MKLAAAAPLVALGALAAAACTPEYAPQGSHHQYVVSSVRMPASAGEAPNFAVVLGTERANRFGAAIAGVIPLAITHTQAIQTGQSSLLLDVQALSLDAAPAAGVTISYGDNPSPPPCNGPPPQGCGQHLRGGASFGLVFNDPPPRTAESTIRNGTLFSEPVAFRVQLSFDGMQTIDIPFVVGRFELRQLTDDRIVTGIIGGAIPIAFLQNTLIDQMQASFNLLLSRDCFQSPGQGCTCAPGSPGGFLDTTLDNDRDCFVSLPELESHPAIRSMRQADLNVEGTDAVSFGMEITAASATF